MSFPYASDNKRYHTLHYYNRNRFGGRVIKAGLDAGLTCPNRDGSCGEGGCIYCEGNSFSFAPPGSIYQQLCMERDRIFRKYPQAKINAYFQNGTNTYGDLEYLRTQWQTALEFPNVVGISIATRADCLGESVLQLLEEFRDQTALTVELGLQTIHDKTAQRVNRGHDFAAFLAGYRALSERNIRVCVHLINGLPGENEQDMLETARVVGRLQPGGVKLHLLYVTMGTALETMWRNGGYVPMEKAQYIHTVAQQLRYLPEETVIERLTGDGDKTRLLAPRWSTDKLSILGGIDRYMAEHQLQQGDLYQSES